MILADKLIDLRKKNGWSQEDMAEKLSVSRQTISKWEGAQSVPDMNRIIKLSEIFGVSTDYLLKDDMETPEVITPVDAETDGEPIRKVSMEEASAFLAYRNYSSARIALGVMMCILSPVMLILLSGAQEAGLISLTENAAAGIGLTVLLLLVAAAVAIFVLMGLRGSRYEYLEKEAIDTEYGVDGMARERMEKYRATYTQQLTTGIVLCVAAAIPLFAAMMITENEFVYICAVCALLILVAVGVLLIVRTTIIWTSMQMLLEEGEYTREEKLENSRNEPVAAIYWGVVVAIFLAYSFITGKWDRSWIIWPVAGVLFGVVMALLKLLRSGRHETR